MGKIVSFYLAIREPLLWISFFGTLYLIDKHYSGIIFLSIWLFTILFSEHSIDRYYSYRNRKN